LGGNDRIDGGGGGDIFFGGPGNDRIRHATRVSGDVGNDVISGTDANDDPDRRPVPRPPLIRAERGFVLAGQSERRLRPSSGVRLPAGGKRPRRELAANQSAATTKGRA